MSFERALSLVLKHEGGYVNHPKDKGGATNKGITQSTYDAWRFRRAESIQSVANISDMEVAAIYKAFYWDKARCWELPEKLDIAHFDAAVNHGCTRAIKLLQKAVGANDDGVFGNDTRTAVSAMITDIGVEAIISNYLDRRLDFYDDIVQHDPSQIVFLKGWTNRVNSLRETLL